jgi:hypothetical protein
LLFDRNRRDFKRRRYLPQGEYIFENVDWLDGEHVRLWWRDSKDELRMQEFEFHKATGMLDHNYWTKPAQPGYNAVEFPTLYEAARRRLDSRITTYKYADEKAQV